MSSDRHTVRLTRRLSAVRLRATAARAGSAPGVAAADEAQLAERRRALEQREAQLASREEELVLRTAQLTDKETLLDEKLSELGCLIDGMARERARMLAANEEEIVSLSLSITQKVLQYEIENGHYKIGEIVRASLRAVRDRGAVVIKVNPRDRELTEAAVSKLEQGSGNARTTIVSDESIPLASCCIETDSGRISSEIAGRLKRIEQSLLRTNGDTNGL